MVILLTLAQRQVAYVCRGGNAYGATKAFVRQFSLNLRTDLHGTAVRCHHIELGLVGGTEFSNVRFKGDDGKAEKPIKKYRCIDARRCQRKPSGGCQRCLLTSISIHWK